MKKQIRKAINHSFKQLGDLVRTVTLKHKTSSSYNRSTGKTNYTYSSNSVNVVITEFSRTEIVNSNIEYGDKKILLPSDQIDFEPIAGYDKIVLNSQEYSIKEVRQKYDSLYILRI